MKSTKRLRSICSMLIMVSMLIMQTSIIFAAGTETEETPVLITLSELENINQYDINGDGQVTAVILPEAASLMSTIRTGTVVEDGVRLRATASTSGTVKELMYYGETVTVKISSTYSEGIYWHYVIRDKTGTSGWAAAEYIAYF